MKNYWHMTMLFTTLTRFVFEVSVLAMPPHKSYAKNAVHHITVTNA